MSIRTWLTILLQIFWESIPCFEVTVKSIIDPDNIFTGNLSQEWVKGLGMCNYHHAAKSGMFDQDMQKYVWNL